MNVNRTLTALLLAMALLFSAACAAELPMDTRIYPVQQSEDGAIALQWGGPDLPKGTEYELLQTAVTDTDCIIGKCDEPFHKFAQIAYTDEKGGQQQAWVMAYDLNRAFEGDYSTEDAAKAYAQRFFSNQYVLASEADADVQLTASAEGWHAELTDASGAATHRLIFTETGTILSYSDLSFTLPSLEGGAEHVNELGDGANACGAIGMLEWMSRELLPNISFQSIATFAYDEAKNVYSFNADRWEHFISVAVEPELHIVSYVAGYHPEARYGEYLTSGEAAVIGREMLVTQCGLTQEEAASCTLRQTEFNFHPFYVEGLEIDSPYWYLWFATPEGENYREYDIMVDASTGECLYAGGPVVGNG